MILRCICLGILWSLVVGLDSRNEAHRVENNEPGPSTFIGVHRTKRKLFRACPNEQFRASEGHITSPYYPGNYPRDSCYQWSIFVQRTHSLTISFSDFNIAPGPDGTCSGGYLEIGPVPQRRLCGHGGAAALPAPYISQHSLVWLKLITGPYGVSRGFSLDYITGTIPAICKQDELPCADGKCIPSRWWCNNQDECGDRSDEALCLAQAPPYGAGGTIFGGGEAGVKGTPIVPSPGGLDASTVNKGGGTRAVAPVLESRCGPGRFLCMSRQDQEGECFEDYQRCDGEVNCLDSSDESRCDGLPVPCGGYTEVTSGYMTSPNFPKPYPQNKECEWNIHVNLGSVIQIRFQAFELSSADGMSDSEGGDYLEFRDGRGHKSPLLGRYTEQQRPPSVIESTGDWLYIKFHSDLGLHKDAIGFNFTHQIKGQCLLGQEKCRDEADCFSESDKCDGIWHCRRHGWDERGCANCEYDKFSCGSGGRCYTEKEHCNGRGSCYDNRDEKNCTPDICNSVNGTYLCVNGRCIYESWICDGTNDCEDNSDERDCVSTPSIRVILAAVVGSLICGLLLVIALGCTLHMFAIRLQDQAGPQYDTPMSRIQAEFMRRQAPPTYNEAMQTSIPFSEMISQMRATGRRLTRGRRQQGNGADVTLAEATITAPLLTTAPLLAGTSSVVNVVGHSDGAPATAAMDRGAISARVHNNDSFPGSGTASIPATGSGTASVPAPGSGTTSIPATGSGTASIPATGSGTASVPAPGSGTAGIPASGSGTASVPAPGSCTLTTSALDSHTSASGLSTQDNSQLTVNLSSETHEDDMTGLLARPSFPDTFHRPTSGADVGRLSLYDGGSDDRLLSVALHDSFSSDSDVSLLEIDDDDQRPLLLVCGPNHDVHV